MNATTVTINGAHSFNSLQLLHGAVLTHTACTEVQTHKFDLMITGTVTVDATSRIDVSEKGYLPGRTTVNTTVGGATARSGGCYGGLGDNQFYGGNVSAVYGDYVDPDDWGSGGGQGTGGGLVQLTANRLVLNGQVLANGEATWEYGGGSGGGISVQVNTLEGTGSIQANGGYYYAGGGVCAGSLELQSWQHRGARPPHPDLAELLRRRATSHLRLRFRRQT